MTALQAGIQHNYNVAISYYTQKRAMMENYYKEQMVTSIEALEQYINDIVQTFHDSIAQQVINNITYQESKAIVNKTLPDIEIPLPVYDILQKIASAKGKGYTKQGVGALIGNTFENYLVKALQGSNTDFSNAISGAASALANSVVDDLINNLQVSSTGNIKAYTATVKGLKNIRPDIGLNFSKEQLQGYNVELKGLLNLSNLDALKMESLQDHELLKNFLQSNAYGLSVKVWSSANNKEFSQSSILQNMINNQLITYSQYGHRTTWEGQYTMDFVNLQISKYLINIISPTNVAIVTGSGFTWMNDFLANKLFTMQVQLGTVNTSTRGPDGEGFPHIISSSILIKEFKNAEMRFDYKVRMSRRTGRIFMIQRKITTS